MKRMKSMKGLQTHTQKERAREGGGDIPYSSSYAILHISS